MASVFLGELCMLPPYPAASDRAVAGVASVSGARDAAMMSASYVTLLDRLLLDLRKQLLQADP